ncbi:MAG: Yip1 family protein [Pseudomonadota bacterium]
MGAPGEARAVSRALAMLVRPARAWDEIQAQPAEPRALFRGYVLPLAAVPAVCGVIGAAVFGFNIASVGVRMSQAGLLLGSVVGFAATLLAVWLLAIWLDITAPAFGGLRDRRAALNLVGYGATASWIGGVAELYPSVGIPVGILAGLYSLYALYLGLPKLMRIPPERALTAFAAALIATLLLGAARGALVGLAAEAGGPLSATYAPR